MGTHSQGASSELTCVCLNVRTPTCLGQKLWWKQLLCVSRCSQLGGVLCTGDLGYDILTHKKQRIHLHRITTKCRTKVAQRFLWIFSSHSEMTTANKEVPFQVSLSDLCELENMSDSMFNASKRWNWIFSLIRSQFLSSKQRSRQMSGTIRPCKQCDTNSPAKGKGNTAGPGSFFRTGNSWITKEFCFQILQCFTTFSLFLNKKKELKSAEGPLRRIDHGEYTFPVRGRGTGCFLQNFVLIDKHFFVVGVKRYIDGFVRVSQFLHHSLRKMSRKEMTAQRSRTAGHGWASSQRKIYDLLSNMCVTLCGWM